MIEFSEIELFKDLTVLGEDSKKIFDLHNEYNCIGLTYDSNLNILNIAFKPVDENMRSDRICLFFEEVTIAKFELAFPGDKDSATVNSFYRGRFEKDGELFEYSKENQGYFYLEFENGTKFEFFSKKFRLKDI